MFLYTLRKKGNISLVMSLYTLIIFYIKIIENIYKNHSNGHKSTTGGSLFYSEMWQHLYVTRNAIKILSSTIIE